MPTHGCSPNRHSRNWCRTGALACLRKDRRGRLSYTHTQTIRPRVRGAVDFLLDWAGRNCSVVSFYIGKVERRVQEGCCFWQVVTTEANPACPSSMPLSLIRMHYPIHCEKFLNVTATLQAIDPLSDSRCIWKHRQSRTKRAFGPDRAVGNFGRLTVLIRKLLTIFSGKRARPDSPSVATTARATHAPPAFPPALR